MKRGACGIVAERLADLADGDLEHGVADEHAGPDARRAAPLWEQPAGLRGQVLQQRQTPWASAARRRSPRYSWPLTGSSRNGPNVRLDCSGILRRVTESLPDRLPARHDSRAASALVSFLQEVNRETPCTSSPSLIVALVSSRPAREPARPDAARRSHKHYEKPAGTTPRRSRASRWRRGCRTSASTRSRCRTHEPPRAAVHQPGPEPGLRLQPRRGGARVRRGGAARSRAARWRTGARRSCSARTSTRRWTPEDEPKALELVQKAVALKAKATAARARLHRRARRRATPARPRTAPRPTAPTPTRCASWSRQFPHDLDARTLYAEALMDSAAVELLDARRPALRRDARS